MSEPDSPAQPDAVDSSAPARGHRRPLLPLLGALVVGLIIGGGIVAVFSGGDHITVSPRSSAAPVSSPVPATGEPSSGANVALSAACLRAINDAQDASTALGGLADAARHLDAGKLDEIIRRVQEVQRRLAVDLPACHADIQLPPGSTTPAPLPNSPAPSSTH